MHALLRRMLPASEPFYPYSIDYAGKFEYVNAQYLSHAAYGSAVTNQKAFTFSCWFKPTRFGGFPCLMAAYVNANNNTTISSNTDDKLVVHNEIGGSADNIIYPMVFRDPSHWYHLHVIVDTTEAVAADRCKAYVNGVLQTAASGSLGLNDLTYIGDDTASIDMGRTPEGSIYYWDGYMANVVVLTEQKVAVTEAGEFKNNTWVPKRWIPTGSNDHDIWLRFANAADLGENSLGLDLTNNNDVVQTQDTPTNNYPTLDPLWKSYTTDSYISKAGKTKGGTSANDWSHSPLTMALPSTGKWWVQADMDSGSGDYASIGVSDELLPAANARLGQNAGTGVAAQPDGDVLDQGTIHTDAVADWTSSGRLGVLYDADADTVTFYVGSTEYGTYSLSGLAGSVRYFFYSTYTNAEVINAYITDDEIDFIPSGAKTLCTANLPTPEVIDGEEGLWVTTYTGDGSADRDITGSAFDVSAKGLVWVKNRGVARSHRLVDAVRGAPNTIFSDLTNVETAEATGIIDLLTNGFSVGSLTAVNESAEDLVAWVFNMLPKYGMDIVSYEGTGVAGLEVPHNLGVAPEMIHIKNRDAADGWRGGCEFIHDTSPWNYYFELNTTQARAAAVSIFANTAPTANVFTVGNAVTVNTSGENYIAYLFRSVPGFLKVGYYTGNGNADGPRVYTGFRPRYLLTKNVSAAYNWSIIDTAITTYNPAGRNLFANLSNAENVNTNVHQDILANGFKIRNTYAGYNANANRYIYLAIADMAFPFCNAF